MHISDSFELTHTISAKNITNADMLIPENIRNTVNIDVLPTMGWGAYYLYTLSIKF